MVNIILNGNKSNFNFESDELHPLTVLDISLEFIVTIIGNILCLIIVHYERFGGDPMKRSLVNKFISTICFTIAITLFLSAFTLLVRVYFGPFPLTLASVIVYSEIYGVLFICMNVVCVLGFKILESKAFYFANGLNEDFWFAVTEIFNATLCFSLLVKQRLLSGRPLPYVKALAGQPLWQASGSLN